MTRFLVGLIVALALGVMGCSETSGTGGSGAVDGEGGTGGSNSAVFPCTEQGIRDAIAEGGGPHTFDCDGPTTITIDERISIEKDLILDGEGNLTLAGGGLRSEQSLSLELRGLAISVDQSPSVDGVFSALTVIDSRITGGISGFFGLRPGELGLSIRNTIIDGSNWTAGPGAIVIEHSTIQGGDGHGVSNFPAKGSCGSPLTIRNTTISGHLGNGLDLCGEVTVSNSTISDNAGEWAVYLPACAGQIRIANSTVSGDVSGNESSCIEPNRIEFGGVLMRGSCSFEGVEPTSLGHNIESPGNTCGFDQDMDDQVNVSAAALNLGPLQDNGGPTMTHALLAEPVVSVAIEAGRCISESAPKTDQRGVARSEGDHCDVGAFELEQEDEACLFSGLRCVNFGEVAPIAPICEVVVPEQPNACDGTESLENPTSCTPSGSTAAHKLTKMQVIADCNTGYDLDGCTGRSCRVGGLVPRGDGVNGVDNGLSHWAGIWPALGKDFGKLDQALHEAICAGAIDLEIEVDAVPGQSCAVVTVSSDGVPGNPISMNLSNDGCLSGTLGTIPIRIGDVDGSIGNAVVRMTLSAQGFSHGILGGTADASTSLAMVEVIGADLGQYVAQLLDINADLSGDWQAAGCDALSMTLEIGGSAIP